MNEGHVAILGAGSIGVAFAVLFASGGRQVRLWDPDPSAEPRATADLQTRLAMLHEAGLLSAELGAARARVRFVHELAEAVYAAVLVQECAPERIEIKRALFADMAELVDDSTVLASSSSAIAPSLIADGLACADQVLVGHPGNPPYLLPALEVVPTPGTRSDIVDKAMSLYREAGMRPVLVRREVEGFIFNRLQGAVLREAYCLVRDGVATVEDIDTVMRDGLGRRWAFIGPFETIDLNTRGGIASHAEKMGPAYARMGAERGQNDPWTTQLVADVEQQRRAVLPADQWGDRVQWRDRQLLRFRQVFDGPSRPSDAAAPDGA
ncbi:3-hydroxyacyl-CoA dehydrogenase [Microbacterium sp. MC2]